MLLLSAALLIAAAGPALAQSGVDWTQVVRSARPAVVTLRAYDAAGQAMRLGSGFRLPDGRIITTLHVVEGAAWVEAVDPEGELLGTVSYAEALSSSVDIAVLPALGRGGPSLTLAAGEPEIGSPVLAIASPEGLGNTVSDGLVSGFRTEDGARLMQISAPISEGSAGGPILDRHGEVVGVTVAVHTRGQDLNLAAPLRSIRAIAGSAGGRIAFPAARAISGNSGDTHMGREEQSVVLKSPPASRVVPTPEPKPQLPGDAAPETFRVDAVTPEIRDQVEARFLMETNRFRASLGVPPLVRDPRLDRAARRYAEYLAKHERLEHESDVPELRTPDLRATAEGVHERFVGETLALLAATPESAAQRTIQLWSESPGHRRVMLRPVYRRMGVGVAMDSERVWYIVQKYAPDDGREGISNGGAMR